MYGFLFSFLQLFLDLGALADSVAQIVELCTANLTAADDFNLFNVRGMYREGLLHAYTVGYASYGKGLGDSAAVLGNDGAFEKLNSLSVALFDSVVNLDGVTDVEYGGIFLELLVC